MVVRVSGGSFLLLLFAVLQMRGGAVLLAGAARVAFADVSAASPPAPLPAADAPFLPDLASPPAAVRTQTAGDNHSEKQVLVAVILALVAVIVMVVSAFFAWTLWRKAQEALHSKDSKVSNATKGACLDRSGVAAVKKLNCCREEVEKEFENELDFLGNIWHPNVISLLGYCIHKDTRLIVYELMQNGSLETQLHGPSRGSALTWHIRLKIALDAARGLEHLHEHCSPFIIHRDIKSSNILLDSDFNAKISDFGLAIYGGNRNKEDMKPSGTVGYVAPEYLLDGQLTEKSDVYAFGVVLLELLLGRKPVEMIGGSHCQSIVSWAMPQITDRTKLLNIIDPVIRNTMDLRHLYQVAAVAVLCVQPEPSYRPLITDVLHSLVPLVPVELGETLRVVEQSRQAG
ncbi:hypothetical protein ACP70R_046011 [Stipagrostis hirtigluma subsp. patula]